MGAGLGEDDMKYNIRCVDCGGLAERLMEKWWERRWDYVHQCSGCGCMVSTGKDWPAFGGYAVLVPGLGNVRTK